MYERSLHMDNSSSSSKFDASEFLNDVFGSLHLLQDEEGTIWFIGREVADKLVYDNSSAKGHAITRFVRKEDRKALKYKALSTADKAILWQNPNDYSDKWIINECGFYDLLMHSEAKSASDFQHWVTHEVLPSVRKHGGYIMGQEHLEEKERRQLNRQIGDLAEEVDRLRTKLRKKNEKMRELKRSAEINRLCRSKYKEALDDIDRMTKLFEIEDKYNEHLRQHDVDRDVDLEMMRDQLHALRVLVIAHGASDLIEAAIRDGHANDVNLMANAVKVGSSDLKAGHGTNCFLM